MAPFITSLDVGAMLLHLALGIAFGFILESSGFGDARRLVAQFYLTEMRVLKVMFTAIVVASVLVFASAAAGLLDYEQVWVNPTYLWPGIVGGLLLGMGFVVGGYCPGTSLTSAATLKIDGILFVAGVGAGIFFFGETAGLVEGLFNSGNMGRFTLPDLFGIGHGAAVTLVVLLALAFFAFFELLRRLATGDKQPLTRGGMAWRAAGASALVAASVAVAAAGQPDLDERWKLMSPKYAQALEKREIYIEPAELAGLMTNTDVRLLVLDVRPEAEWNRFHLRDAERLDATHPTPLKKRLQSLPANGVVVVVGQDEQTATTAWQRLMALAAPNAYVLEGGMDSWLHAFAHPDEHGERLALGAHHPAAEPAMHHAPAKHVRKVKLKTVGKKAGGCG